MSWCLYCVLLPSCERSQRPTGSCFVNAISSLSIMNNQKQREWKKPRDFSSACAYSFAHCSVLYHAITHFLLFNLFLAHFLHLPQGTPDPQFSVDPLQQNTWITHRVSQTISPGLPLQAIPAVVQAISSGELISRAPGVASLSPDNSQEGQPAKIHLKSTSTASSYITWLTKSLKVWVHLWLLYVFISDQP